MLWLDGDRRGRYTKLDNPFGSLLKQPGEVGDSFEDSEVDEFEFPEQFLPSPEKPPQFSFDFVEVCGGAGKVSKSMADRGYVVAPPLDISESQKYDLRDLRLVEWAIHMLEEKLFKSMMAEPPCTTFSPAAHPACRSYSLPVGWVG